jgi:hypothetical protein
VAPCSIDTNQGAAGWAELGARLIVFAAPQETAGGVLHSVDAPLPLIGNRQSASLRAVLRVPIIPELRQSPRNARESRRNVDKFEEVGRKLDEELTRLRRFVEEDLAPKTEERTAQFLREVSEKLTEAAGWLDARRSARETEKSKETSA